MSGRKPTQLDMFSAGITALECVGGWIVVYAPVAGWISAVNQPESLTGSVWMVPGWQDQSPLSAAIQAKLEAEAAKAAAKIEAKAMAIKAAGAEVTL